MPSPLYSNPCLARLLLGVCASGYASPIHARLVHHCLLLLSHSPTDTDPSFSHFFRLHHLSTRPPCPARHFDVLSFRPCTTNTRTFGPPFFPILHSDALFELFLISLTFLLSPSHLHLTPGACAPSSRCPSFRLCITYSARFALLCLLFPSHYHALTSIRISLPFCRLQSLHILTCILSRLLLSQSCVNSYSNISALFADSHLRSFRPPGLARLPAGVMSFWLYIISLPRHVLIYLLFLL